MVRDTPIIIEFMQQDGRKKRTAKRLHVTKVIGLLLASFLVISTNLIALFFFFFQKDLFKRRGSFAKKCSNIITEACHTRFTVFFLGKFTIRSQPRWYYQSHSGSKLGTITRRRPALYEVETSRSRTFIARLTNKDPLIATFYENE